MICFFMYDSALCGITEASADGSRASQSSVCMSTWTSENTCTTVAWAQWSRSGVRGQGSGPGPVEMNREWMTWPPCVEPITANTPNTFIRNTNTHALTICGYFRCTAKIWSKSDYWSSQIITVTCKLYNWIFIDIHVIWILLSHQCVCWPGK